MTARPRRSLAGRLSVIGAVPLVLAVALAATFTAWLDEPWLAALLSASIVVPLWAWAIARALAPTLALFRAMGGTVASYRDNDFSFGLHWDDDDELADLVAAHNALGATLRDQRLALVQRELLLDTMVQHTPVAMLLIDPGERVVYGNLAARRLLGDGRRLEGAALADLLAATPAPMRDAFLRGGDGLFSVAGDADAAAPDEDAEETYHLARRGFRLNGRSHELFLLRRLTAELRRQEVKTWKKVIRVISHELNNSLAPVASLAHSGGELVRRGQHERLASVFETIEERARHLDGFIRGYASFAKLPTPRLETVVWAELLERLRGQIAFALEAPPSEWSVRADPAQLAQALVNIVKNAHESGSAIERIEVRVRRVPDWYHLDVLDRGGGLAEAALAGALVPFYSTKRTGTGLGLALAREIAEAHGGTIAIGNRPEGGAWVTLSLPA